jgi:RES domain-containing protein
MLSPNLHFDELLSWVASQQLRPLEGSFFRVAGPRHTSAEAVLSGIGAKKAGGRWNPREAFLAVYMSREPETALREANEHYRHYKLPLSQATPRVVVAVELKLEKVLDLTDAGVVTGLPVRLEDLLAEDWREIMTTGAESASQALGRAAFEAGLQGLLIPSKPDPTGQNLIVFRENLAESCRFHLVNADELDKLGR